MVAKRAAEARATHAEALSSDLTQAAREKVMGDDARAQAALPRRHRRRRPRHRHLATSPTSSTTRSPRPPRCTSTAPAAPAAPAVPGTAISLIHARELGNFYYLKLQYDTIVFRERFLPPADQLAAQRMEVKLDGISKRFPELVSPEWVLLARNLMADPRGERVIGLLLERAMKQPPPQPQLEDGERPPVEAAAEGEAPRADLSPRTYESREGEERRDARPEYRERRDREDRFGRRDRDDRRDRRDRRPDREDRFGRRRDEERLRGDEERPRRDDDRPRSDDARRADERPRDEERAPRTDERPRGDELPRSEEERARRADERPRRDDDRTGPAGTTIAGPAAMMTAGPAGTTNAGPAATRSAARVATTTAGPAATTSVPAANLRPRARKPASPAPPKPPRPRRWPRPLVTWSRAQARPARRSRTAQARDIPPSRRGRLGDRGRFVQWPHIEPGVRAAAADAAEVDGSSELAPVPADLVATPGETGDHVGAARALRSTRPASGASGGASGGGVAASAARRPGRTSRSGAASPEDEGDDEAGEAEAPAGEAVPEASSGEPSLGPGGRKRRRKRRGRLGPREPASSPPPRSWSRR